MIRNIFTSVASLGRNGSRLYTAIRPGSAVPSDPPSPPAGAGAGAGAGTDSDADAGGGPPLAVRAIHPAVAAWKAAGFPLDGLSGFIGERWPDGPPPVPRWLPVLLGCEGLREAAPDAREILLRAALVAAKSRLWSYWHGKKDNELALNDLQELSSLLVALCVAGETVEMPDLSMECWLHLLWGINRCWSCATFETLQVVRTTAAAEGVLAPDVHVFCTGCRHKLLKGCRAITCTLCTRPRKIDPPFSLSCGCYEGDCRICKQARRLNWYGVCKACVFCSGCSCPIKEMGATGKLYCKCPPSEDVCIDCGLRARCNQYGRCREHQACKICKQLYRAKGRCGCRGKGVCRACGNFSKELNQFGRCPDCALCATCGTPVVEGREAARCQCVVGVCAGGCSAEPQMLRPESLLCKACGRCGICKTHKAEKAAACSWCIGRAEGHDCIICHRPGDLDHFGRCEGCRRCPHCPNQRAFNPATGRNYAQCQTCLNRRNLAKYGRERLDEPPSDEPPSDEPPSDEPLDAPRGGPRGGPGRPPAHPGARDHPRGRRGGGASAGPGGGSPVGPHPVGPA